jgi:hypothetical protein
MLLCPDADYVVGFILPVSARTNLPGERTIESAISPVCDVIVSAQMVDDRPFLPDEVVPEADVDRVRCTSAGSKADFDIPQASGRELPVDEDHAV